MPVSTEIRTELDLTIFTATGETPYSELMEALESFYAGSPTENEIWDCSRVTTINILGRELRTIVQYTKQHIEKRPKGNTALIANSTLKYGLARMTSIFAEITGLPWKMKIFKNLDEALEWITKCQQAGNKLKN